jgi:hypothetical protein
MPILVRILPQVSHLLENLNFFSFSHSFASSQSFLSVSKVLGIILNILKSKLKVFEKKIWFMDFFICLAFKLIRIRQNDVDPTRSC